MKTFYLQQLSTFQAVNFDASLIIINWKIRKFLNFKNTPTSFDECAIFEAVYKAYQNIFVNFEQIVSLQNCMCPAKISLHTRAV